MCGTHTESIDMHHIGKGSVGVRPGPSKSDLTEVAQVSFAGVDSVEGMAQRENWTPELYAVALSENIRNSEVPLDVQRERLAMLGSVGAMANAATASELARHYSILEALFHRFSVASIAALDKGGLKAGETSERYLSAALKAQRGALGCLSALTVLRGPQVPGGVGKS